MMASLTVSRTSAASIAEELRRVSDDLVHRYPHVPAERVRMLVERSADHLRGAKIIDYVPILVRHEVTTALRQGL